MLEQAITMKKDRIAQKEKEIDAMYSTYKKTGDKSLIFRVQDLINELEHLYIELKMLEAR